MRVSVASLTVVGTEPRAASTKSTRPARATAASMASSPASRGRSAKPAFRRRILPRAGRIPPIPRWDFNPERIRIESAGSSVSRCSPCNRATSSDRSPVRSTTVAAPTPSSPTARARPSSRLGTLATTVSTAAGNEVTVASFNLQRFFDTVDDPVVADPVLTPTAYDTRLSKASIAIRTHLRQPGHHRRAGSREPRGAAERSGRQDPADGGAAATTRISSRGTTSPAWTSASS